MRRELAPGRVKLSIESAYYTNPTKSLPEKSRWPDLARFRAVLFFWEKEKNQKKTMCAVSVGWNPTPTAQT